jgi:hypothetical protein
MIGKNGKGHLPTKLIKITPLNNAEFLLLNDEGMTPRVLDIGLSATAQEQDGHLKPKKPKTN